MNIEEKEKIREEAKSLLLELASKGMSAYEIAKMTNQNQKTIGNYIKRGGLPSFSIAQSITRWGKENSEADDIMQLSDIKNKEEQNSIIETDNTNILKDTMDNVTVIPLLPISAQGGTFNDFVLSIKKQDCEKIISPILDADFAIPVSGDSMLPEYPSGSKALVKKINREAFIEWGCVYVLDTCNGIIIKQIVPSDKEGYIKCVSLNPNPKFAPFDVATDNIFGMYRVMMCLSPK